VVPVSGTGTQRVGRYRLLRVIGEGGMGVVHLGLDPAERAVAVKVVRPHVAADPQTRDRLAREVRSLSKVRHPRVAEVLDADFDAELPYVVMRYVPGEALDTVVRRDGPLARPVLDELAVGLFEAVSAIHSVGVVHRDLKPGNVLLLDGSPVVIDFGIARALDDVSLTSTGLMVGTPGYLSPEVLDGVDVGNAADWWGWGAVMAFAATGRPPFRAGPLEAVWDRVRRGAADLDGVDPRLGRVLAATLRPDPSTRPSPGQLADAIAALTGRRPVAVAGGDGGDGGGPAVTPPTTPTRVAPRPEPLRDTRPEPRPQPSPVSGPQPKDPRRAVAPVAAPPTRVIERPPPAAPPRPHAPAPVPVASAPVLHPVVHPGRTGWGTGAGAGSGTAVAPGPTTAYAPVPGAALAPVASGPGPTGGGPVAPRTSYGVGQPPVPPLPRRHHLTALALVVVVAVAAVAPAGAAILVLVWASLARAVQWSRVAAAIARVRAGRLGAGARTGLAVMYPVRLVGAALTTAGYLLLGVLAASPLLLVAAAVLLQGVAWDDVTTARAVLSTPPVLTGAVALAAVLVWFGPGGRAVREGSRAITEPVARTRNGRLVLTGLAALVVVAAVLVVSAGL
jgi:serine/threonine protein kinase